MIEVLLVPLAKEGFVPVDPVSNPVRWYLERVDTGNFVAGSGSYATEAEARAEAERRGLTVQE